MRGFGFPVEEENTLSLKKGAGCLKCRNTGFLGRCGIFEIFSLSDSIKKLISQGANASEINKVARQEGMTTLKEDAWQKVLNGTTTFEEAIRVTGTA
jgi:general secretion pathway protein E